MGVAVRWQEGSAGQHGPQQRHKRLLAACLVLIAMPVLVDLAL